MKILLCHNYYQQRGGEDQSFEDEAWLLEARGHHVVRYIRHNDEIDHIGRWNLTQKTLLNQQTYREVRKLIRHERPRLVHCTNTFPLISPAVYYAAQAEGLPVVQSLRNYRMFCLNGYFFRDGKVCEDCMGKSVSWPGILHSCYRQNRTASAVVASMLSLHRAINTWTRRVNIYYTPSEFSREKFIEGGIPGEKIQVKPNFVNPDPGAGKGSGNYAVFVGRLSAEKGIGILMNAWSKLEAKIRLKIIGDGPLSKEVRRIAQRNPNVEWLGSMRHGDLLSVVGEAKFLICPSVWYETFGRIIMEAFAKGVPVLASRLGAMAELIDDGRTGLLFEPGDAKDLVFKIQEMLNDTNGSDRMRQEARNEYEAKYTAESNYRALMALYGQATATRGTGSKEVEHKQMHDLVKEGSDSGQIKKEAAII